MTPLVAVLSVPLLPLADAPAQTIGFPVLVVLSWIPYHIRVRGLAAEKRPVPTWRQVCYALGPGDAADRLKPARRHAV